jgi:hypothetical protein
MANKEFKEKYGRKYSWPNLKIPSTGVWKKQRKRQKPQDTRCAGRDSNLATPVYTELQEYVSTGIFTVLASI